MSSERDDKVIGAIFDFISAASNDEINGSPRREGGGTVGNTGGDEKERSKIFVVIPEVPSRMWFIRSISTQYLR